MGQAGAPRACAALTRKAQVPARVPASICPGHQPTGGLGARSPGGTEHWPAWPPSAAHSTRPQTRCPVWKCAADRREACCGYGPRPGRKSAPPKPSWKTRGPWNLPDGAWDGRRLMMMFILGFQKYPPILDDFFPPPDPGRPLHTETPFPRPHPHLLSSSRAKGASISIIGKLGATGMRNSHPTGPRGEPVTRAKAGSAQTLHSGPKVHLVTPDRRQRTGCRPRTWTGWACRASHQLREHRTGTGRAPAQGCWPAGPGALLLLSKASRALRGRGTGAVPVTGAGG